REKVRDFKDGTQFTAEELGVDPAKSQGPLTKKTYAGKAGLEIAAPKESRFESVDGSYVRQQVEGPKGPMVVEQDLKDGKWYQARTGGTTLLNPEFDYSKMPAVNENLRAAGLDRKELARRDANGDPVYTMAMKDGKLEVQSADYVYKVEKGPDGN